MLSQSEENYLKSIYHLSVKETKGISTNAIAEKMNTKASSVTDMIKRLSEKELVLYKKYQGVRLSEEGKKIAISIVRKHRLWECFLVEKLHFSWDEVHDIAEELEHIKSERLIDKLDEFLEHPTIDPHGDPIPDKDGNITTSVKVKLSALKENAVSELVTVKDATDEFLKYLNKKSISIGVKVRVVSWEPFDKTMTIEIEEKQFTITEEIAERLLVKIIKLA